MYMSNMPCFRLFAEKDELCEGYSLASNSCKFLTLEGNNCLLIRLGILSYEMYQA